MHSKQFAAGATPPPPPPPPDPQPRPVARCQPQPASPVPPQGRPPLGCSRWCDAQLPTCAAFPHSAMTAGHRRPLMSWQCNPSGVVQRWEPTGMGARQGGVATEVGRPGLCVPLAGRRPRLACTQGGRRRLAAGLTICSGRAPCMRCPAAAHHGMTPRIVDGCDCATPPPRGDSPSPAGQRSTRRPLHSGQAAPRSPPPPHHSTQSTNHNAPDLRVGPMLPPPPPHRPNAEAGQGLPQPLPARPDEEEERHHEKEKER